MYFPCGRKVMQLTRKIDVRFNKKPCGRKSHQLTAGSNPVRGATLTMKGAINTENAVRVGINGVRTSPIDTIEGNDFMVTYKVRCTKVMPC